MPKHLGDELTHQCLGQEPLSGSAWSSGPQDLPFVRDDESSIQVKTVADSMTVEDEPAEAQPAESLTHRAQILDAREERLANVTAAI
ncbi:MAG: hypothetical protein AAF657_11825 [Acidobacteriota bacterium]